MKYALFLTESDIDLQYHLSLADRVSDSVTPVFILKTIEYVDRVLAAGHAAFTYRELYDRYLKSSERASPELSDVNLAYESYYLNKLSSERYQLIFAQWMDEPNFPSGGKGTALIHLQKQAWLLESALRALCNELKPAFASIWNGLFLPSSAASRCIKNCGVPLHYCEEGFFPRTMTIDHVGVNFASGLASPSRFDEPSLKAFTSLTVFLESYHRNKKSRGALEIEGRNPFPSGKRVIFYPAQIDTDTNIVLASPLFPSNDDVIVSLKRAMNAITDSYLVVKTHPRDPGSLERLKRHGDESTLVTEAGNIHDWIAGSDVVVTRNSTVGLEALTYRKRVITLADSIYSGHGFTIDVRTGEALGSALRSAMELKEMQGRDFSSFLGFLYELLTHHTLWLTESSLVSDSDISSEIPRSDDTLSGFKTSPWVDSRVTDARIFKQAIEAARQYFQGLAAPDKISSVAIFGGVTDKSTPEVIEWVKRSFADARIRIVSSQSYFSSVLTVFHLFFNRVTLVVIVTTILPRRPKWKYRLLAAVTGSDVMIIDSTLKTMRVQ